MNLVTIFSEELMHALGWSLIHSLWQGAVIALLLAMVLLFFRKSSSKFRYRLSVGSLFLIFGLFIGTFVFFYSNANLQKAEKTIIEHDEFIEFIVETTNVSRAENTDFLTAYVDYFNTHLPFVVTLWLMGMMVFALRFLGGLAYTQRLKHSQNLPMAFEWEEVMMEIKTRLKITQNIQLVESKLVSVPMVIGYLKPMILLPIGVVNQLSISEVEAVMAHELAHIKRYDYLVNIIQSIIETLLFFHPAIWWISGEIRRERENCCDDLALGIVDNLTFAKALATLEQFRLNSIYQRKPQFSMAAITSKNQLLNRVQRILNQPQKNQHNFRGFFAALILAISFVGTSLDAQKVEMPEQTNEPNVPVLIDNIEIETDLEFPEINILADSIESSELPQLVAPVFPNLTAPTFPNNLEANNIEVIVSPNSETFNLLPRKNIIVLQNTNVKSNATLKIKADKSKILDDIISITIRKDTSITDEIQEITIVRKVKNKNGKAVDLTIEIKSVDGIKTVTTYENGRKLTKDELEQYKTYIDESYSIANKDRIRFSGDRDAIVRLRQSENEAIKKYEVEMVELRKQLAKEKAKMNRAIAEQSRTLTLEQAKLERENAEQIAALAREQAVIERELAEHSKELALEFQEQLKALKEEEVAIAEALTIQKVELEREMAEKALMIAKSKRHDIWVEKFKEEMIKDGILEEGVTSFKLKMDDKGIKVNGKKLTKEQEEKYFKMYEHFSGGKWYKGSAIQIRVKDEEF